MLALSFACEQSFCVASLHQGAGATGVLMVSGGQDVRAGAHGWQRDLANALGDAGYPSFRFDRRGIGDSGGVATRFDASEPDLAAALAAFRAAAPHVARVIGIGNCDGATALALFGSRIGIDGFVLLNPWLVDDESADDASPLPPPAAIRRRYASRLTDPAAWRRLLTGQIDLGKAVAGLLRATRSDAGALAGRVAASLADGPAAQIILSEGDATGIACAAALRTRAFAAVRSRAGVTTLPTGSHSFAGEGDAERLRDAVLAALKRFA